MRRCQYCQLAFPPSPYHPQQTVCGEADCQLHRRKDYHRHKIENDPDYAQVCRDSRKKWRDTHPGYDRQYRQAHPSTVERNRAGQRRRDQKRRLVNLAKNNLALDLKHSAAGVWLVGPGAGDLAKNNLAPLQVFIFQSDSGSPPTLGPSCQEHPSGEAADHAA
jgi:hypothetical protein